MLGVTYTHIYLKNTDTQWLAIEVNKGIILACKCTNSIVKKTSKYQNTHLLAVPGGPGHNLRCMAMAQHVARRNPASCGRRPALPGMVEGRTKWGFARQFDM